MTAHFTPEAIRERLPLDRAERLEADLPVDEQDIDHLLRAGERLAAALEDLQEETIEALLSIVGSDPPNDKLEDQPVLRQANAALAAWKEGEG